jgi:hypothetical protein
MYEQKSTQENQILDLLTASKGAGVYSYQLATPHPEGLGILQYNARIYGLRHKGHKIISDRKGHYVLETRPTIEDLRKKVEQNKIQAVLNKYATAGAR